MFLLYGPGGPVFIFPSVWKNDHLVLYFWLIPRPFQCEQRGLILSPTQKTNCFAFSGFMGRDPDWQRETAACNVMWTVTQLMLHTDFNQRQNHFICQRQLIQSCNVVTAGVWFPGYKLNSPTIVNWCVCLMLKCMKCLHNCRDFGLTGWMQTYL